MHKLTSTAIFVLALGALSGCPEPAPSGDASSASARFVVYNDSSFTIDEIYVTPADEESWGPDILDLDLLAPGDEAVVALDPGVWDIKIIDDEGEAHFFYDVDFRRDDLTLTVED